MAQTGQSRESIAVGDRPPASVTRLVTELGVGDVDLTIASAVDRDGGNTPTWLVVAERAAVVVRGREAPVVELNVPAREVGGIVADARVGSGMVQLELGGRYLDVLRYRNRDAYPIQRAVAFAEKLLAGRAATLEPDELVDPRRCPKCGLRLPSLGESCVRCISRRGVLRRMGQLLWPHRDRAFAMLLLMLTGVTLDLLSPQLTRYLVDHVLPGSQAEAAVAMDPSVRPTLLEALLVVVGVLAGVQTARMVLNVFSGQLSAIVGSALTYDVRRRLVEHLQGLGIEYFERQQVGSLVGRVAYDTEAVHDLIRQLTGGFILQLVMVVGVFVMMMTLDLQLALLALLPSPLVMGATVFFWRKIYPRYYRFWDAASNQAGALTGLLRGVRVVKFFGQEDRETKRFDEYSHRFMRHRQDVDGSIAVFNGAVGVLFQLGGWFVWYFGGSDVIDAELSLGELMAFFGYMWMFYGPLAALPQLTSWLTQFATQSHRIFEILDTPVTLPAATEPTSREHVRGRIDLERVTFSYESHNPVIKDLDLHVEPGETIGLVGGSGSGKSTLVNLLCRLYDVEHGHVRIDGIDVRDYDKQTLRRSIGVVPQETMLFSGTILENIAYGDPEAPLAAVLRAAEAAQCHSFVLGHPLAYDTALGENGTGLSGGERQRIGIARALLTDPPILVLDEATSNVDPVSEAAIQTALDRIGRGKTTIAIAHRLSALRNADRIVVMDGGRIAEIGAPEELVARGGSYAKMVRLHGLPGRPVYRADLDEIRRAAPLEPAHARILGDGRRGLLVEIDDVRHDDVFVVDCFPITKPGQFLALQQRRDEDHADDLGILVDPSRWPDNERERLAHALQSRYLWHRVERITDARLENDLLVMHVVTQLGAIELTVKRGPQWARDTPDGKLVVDVDDEFYRFPPTTELSARELEILRRYADW